MTREKAVDLVMNAQWGLPKGWCCWWSGIRVARPTVMLPRQVRPSALGHGSMIAPCPQAAASSHDIEGRATRALEIPLPEIRYRLCRPLVRTTAVS